MRRNKEVQTLNDIQSTYNVSEGQRKILRGNVHMQKDDLEGSYKLLDCYTISQKYSYKDKNKG